MGISAITRKETAAKVGPAGAIGQAAALSLSGDQLAFSRRDGGPERAPVPETPGLKKIGIGGAIAGMCIIGLGLTLSAASAPLWLPLAFGAGVVVGAAILFKGVKEFAGDLTRKLDVSKQLEGLGK